MDMPQQQKSTLTMGATSLPLVAPIVIFFVTYFFLWWWLIIFIIMIARKVNTLTKNYYHNQSTTTTKKKKAKVNGVEYFSQTEENLVIKWFNEYCANIIVLI